MYVRIRRPSDPKAVLRARRLHKSLFSLRLVRSSHFLVGTVCVCPTCHIFLQPRILTPELLAVIFEFAQTPILCRLRLFDTGELFTKSRQPCGHTFHILDYSARRCTELSTSLQVFTPHTHCYFVYQHRSAQDRRQASTSCRPNASIKQAYLWFAFKRVRSATLRGFGFPRLWATDQSRGWTVSCVQGHLRSSLIEKPQQA